MKKTDWDKMYKLANNYYQHYGNLIVSRDFITKNGYQYDATGLELGSWLNSQRIAYKRAHDNKNTSLTPKQISKLENIGMIWNVFQYRWDEMYKLAQVYYEKNGNLDIPIKFKTINGYEDNSKGLNLGNWIHNQRNAYKGKGTAKINTEQIIKLENIGMIWDVPKSKWDKMYQLAHIYYHHYGHLHVHRNFKTQNGYEYDDNGFNLGTWINSQRQAFKGQCTYDITIDHLSKLDDIDIQWLTEENNLKLQEETIKSTNSKRKQKEILNRTINLLNELKDIEQKPFTSKEDIDNINKCLIKKLK